MVCGRARSGSGRSGAEARWSWHDAESSRALFERIGSDEKYLHSSPGRHQAVPTALHELALDFLASRLRAAP